MAGFNQKRSPLCTQGNEWLGSERSSDTCTLSCLHHVGDTRTSHQWGGQIMCSGCSEVEEIVTKVSLRRWNQTHLYRVCSLQSSALPWPHTHRLTLLRTVWHGHEMTWPFDLTPRLAHLLLIFMADISFLCVPSDQAAEAETKYWAYNASKCSITPRKVFQFWTSL